MRTITLKLLALVLSGALVATAIPLQAHLGGDFDTPVIIDDGKIPYPRIEIQQVFGIFHAAVDRGELILFEERLTRRCIEARNVIYEYRPGNRYPLIKIYSDIIEPMAVPDMPSMRIIGVTAVLDEDGHVIETIAHVGQ